ncbi:MAG: hypothetical protein KDA67_10520 [Rhodobacteraceae bacterium]|nr:hypothetical protein [Paracoccaceae bacterium]
MQITLNQDEILTAIENYVRSQINIADNQRSEIDLKAGRGEYGFTATLDIVPADMIRETAPEAATPSKGSPELVPTGAAKPEPIKAGQVKEELAKASKSSSQIFGKKADTVIMDEASEASESDETETPEAPEPSEASEEELAKAPRSIFSKQAS